MARQELEVQAAWQEQARAPPPLLPPPPLQSEACVRPRAMEYEPLAWYQSLISSQSLASQVHRSRVTALACSPDGAALWCGCDAQAPMPSEQEEPGSEPPVALVDPSVSNSCR